MKRPRTLSLPPVQHHHASSRVRNALDGQGSLHGFLDHIERAGARLARYGSAASPADGSVSTETSFEGDPLEPLAGLSVGDIFSVRDRYLPQWHKVLAALPWTNEDPAAAHVLGLLARLDDRAAWQPVAPVRATAQARFDIPEERSKGAHGATEYEHLLATYRDARGETLGEQLAVANVSFRPRSVDATWHPDHPETMSLSLNPEVHDPFRRAIGSEFYARVENALLVAFLDPTYTVDIFALCAFLENQEVPPVSVEEALKVILDEMDEVEGLMDPDQVLCGEPLTEEALAKSFDRPLDGNREVWLDALIANLRFDPVRREPGHSFWQDLEEVHDENGPATFTLVQLLRDAGLVVNGADLRALEGVDVLDAVASRFSIDKVGPSRQNALHVLAHTPLPPDTEGDASSAIDYHVIELFRSYVEEVVDDPDLWRHRAVWTTLSRPELFPLQATLQAWTGASANRRLHGPWTLERSRRSAIEYDHPDVQRACRALNWLAPIGASPYDPVARATPFTLLPPELRSDGRVRIPTGEPLIEEALAALDQGQTDTSAAFAVLEALLDPDDAEAFHAYRKDWEEELVLAAALDEIG